MTEQKNNDAGGASLSDAVLDADWRDEWDGCNQERMTMIDAINLLKTEALSRRSMTTPNQHTITEWTARENERLANQYDLAAEALRRMHNKAFADGILEGVKAIADSCQRRRERKTPNA
jgi:hypothetical protein